MPSGIQVRNATNFIQIDSDNPNMKLFSKVNVATTQAQADMSYGYTPVTGLPGIPMVACASAAGATAQVNSYSNGTASIGFTSKGGVGQGVTLYIFARPQNSADNGGFEVRDGSGVLAFDGSANYLKVVQAFGGTPSDNALDSAAVALPAGATYAALCSSIGFSQRDVNQQVTPSVPDWFRYSFRGFAKIVGTSFYIASANFEITHYGTSLPGTGPFSAGFVGVLIDVTGL